MNHFEVEEGLRSMVLIVDTREQDTPKFKKRIEQCGLPVIRKKLIAGDYSVKCIVGGSEISLEEAVSIERKMNADELCQCFGTGRKRFEREFERAKDIGMKVHLLIENENWASLMSGDYRSRLTPEALCASLWKWQAKYNMPITHCSAEETGTMIRYMLKYELKHYLESVEGYETGGAIKRAADG